MNELTDMRGLYREILRDRRRELEVVLDKYRASPGATEEELRRLAHKIAGSGSAFGFPRITEAARAAEHAPEGGVAGAVDELVAAMAAVLESQRRCPVLVVAPESPWWTEFGARLTSTGRPVVRARSAGEAGPLLNGEEVALIVLDLLLPDQDGRRFLAELREDGLNSCVPVFVLAAHVNDDLRNECLAYGSVRCFQKPVSILTLVQAVDEKVKAKPESDVAVEGFLGRVGLTRLYHRAEMLRRGLQTPWSLAMVEADGETAAAADRLGPLLQHEIQGGGAVGLWEDKRYVVLFLEQGMDRAEELLWALLERTRRESPPILFRAGLVNLVDNLSIEEAVARAGTVLRSTHHEGPARFARFQEQSTVARKIILLAEDDELVVALVRHRLEREGFSLRCFSAGAEAFQNASAVDPHLMILDVKMPGMDGFELLERLRAEPRFERTPVLMLTSMGDESNVVKGLSLGANDYILKPFSPVELVARVHRHLRAR